MKKKKYLTLLRKEMKGLSPDTVRKTLDYYDEMISDRMEEGLSEEEAVSVMEDPAAIVSGLVREKYANAAANDFRRQKSGSVWQKVLIVLGFPLWLPLLIAFASIVLALFIVLIAVIVSLCAAEASLVLGGSAGVLGGLIRLCQGNPLQAMAIAGGCLVCVGLGVILFKPTAMLVKKLCAYTAGIPTRLKRRYYRKAV